MPMPGRNKRKERSLPEPEPEPSGIPSSSADDHHLSSSSSSADHSLSSRPPSTRPCLPPGFNYRPNDLEVLLLLCQKRDYLGGNRDFLVDLPVHLVNIYESNPEQLTVKFKKGNDTEWFFISKKNKMGKGGKKQKRCDKGGYWHATVASEEIDDGQGSKTALSYYVDQCPPSASADDDDYSLCKIYRSTQAIKEKNKAEEEENEQQQPPTVKYHQQQPLNSYQPQPQPHHDIAYQQQLLFQPAPLDSYQPQSSDLAYQQQQQFWPGPLDSYRPHRWQFSAARPDSHQLQPYYDSTYQL
ncbi:PREDICTED: NAC domain-containing protein 19-like [Camelina sativa]|uniref:NAC domain-containing protein 19-like n=1 Tax=Camelina sativa TaxID=90675 RepID=A0ABM0ZBL7_CAMSA|nr:PREDICTED: NAC domain-containing protein 19-like [Camelina sativa]